LENGETRVVLKLPAALAPVKLAVMPLVKKDGLPEKAREIMNDSEVPLQLHIMMRRIPSASAIVARMPSVLLIV
jgi:glycyl-tRNA synthetase (class II)